MSLPKFKQPLAYILLGFTSMGMSQSGCPQGGGSDAALNQPLAGVWEITRGTVSATFKWKYNSGGEVKQDSGGGQLAPLDPNSFPADLKPLIDQWNAGLADLNAKIDAALPRKVIVTFPRYGVIKLTNADDPTKVAEGAINAAGGYIFVGDVSGAASGSQQGGGAVLQASTVQGTFDRTALTTAGSIARTLIVLLNSNDDRFGLSAQISIAFTGVRTGDAPTSN